MGMEVPLTRDIEAGVCCVDLPNGFKLAYFYSVSKYGLYTPDYLWLRTLDGLDEALELIAGLLSSSKHKAFSMLKQALPAEDGAPKDSRR